MIPESRKVKAIELPKDKESCSIDKLTQNIELTKMIMQQNRENLITFSKLKDAELFIERSKHTIVENKGIDNFSRKECPLQSSSCDIPTKMNRRRARFEEMRQVAQLDEDISNDDLKYFI